jgi:MFS family permease
MSSTSSEFPPGPVIRSRIPARIDRLPWSPFHTRMVMALGVAWVLDGLEITIASAVAGILSEETTLGLSSTAIGAIATVYLAGEVVGALFFGRLSDTFGRRSLFIVTLAVYLLGKGLPTHLPISSQPCCPKVERLPTWRARRIGGGPSRRASHAPAVRSGR